MTLARETRPSDGFRVLDGKGCVTLEVMCYAEQLTPEQRAAVERHTRTCSLCAQQQAALARAVDRFRQARPRLHLPPELKLLVRQAALRALVARRRAAGMSDKIARYRPRWYQTRLFEVIVLIACVAALIVVLLW